MTVPATLIKNQSFHNQIDLSTDWKRKRCTNIQIHEITIRDAPPDFEATVSLLINGDEPTDVKRGRVGWWTNQTIRKGTSIKHSNLLRIRQGQINTIDLKVDGCRPSPAQVSIYFKIEGNIG